jgi:molecular chaperone DnaJ
VFKIKVKMAKKDYYEVLGVDKTASTDEIKKAYRKLAKENHPDKKPGDKAAEDMFKEISEAYEHLSDPTKKQKYDQFGHSNGNQFGGFGGFGGFTTRRKRVRVGETLTLGLKLTLEEIFSGVKKTYKYNRQENCHDCGGVGGLNTHTCTNCNGSGEAMEILNTPFGTFAQSSTCQVCDGTGTSYDVACQTCNGGGLKTIEEVIDIDVPNGVQNNMTFLMKGKGHSIKGGVAGDLHIQIIEKPHEVFTRINDDLKMKLKLTYPQLVLGDKVDISTIEGGKIRITIPPYSDVDTNLKIQKKGLKVFKGEERGDLIVTLGVSIPKTITEEEKELLEKLK